MKAILTDPDFLNLIRHLLNGRVRQSEATPIFVAKLTGLFSDKLAESTENAIEDSGKKLVPVQQTRGGDTTILDQFLQFVMDGIVKCFAGSGPVVDKPVFLHRKGTSGELADGFQALANLTAADLGISYGKSFALDAKSELTIDVRRDHDVDAACIQRTECNRLTRIVMQHSEVKKDFSLESIAL